MNALWRAIGVGGGIPNFPYTIGEEIDTKGCLPSGNNLKLFHGSKTGDDKGSVTIFQYQRVTELEALAHEGIKNSMKRAKSLMLPGCLRCHDAVEHNETIYFATEECMPLNYVLSSDALRDSFYDDEEKFEHVVALGLDTVGSTLKSMHSNSLVHGAVNSDNIYVLKNGLWRLFGYEAMSTSEGDGGIGGGAPPMYRRMLPLMREHRRAPELGASTGSSSGGGGGGGGAQLIDSWGLGCLTYEVFHAVSSSTKASDMKSGRNIPRELQQSFVGLIGTNPKLRHGVEKFLNQANFIREDPFVIAVSNLEELNLKDATEKDRYYRQLANGCDQFPLLCCQRMLLPKLATVVQYGGSSAAVLEPLLKIGKRLSSEDFGQSVAPAVVSLFASPEHLIRCRLLSAADSYAKYLPQKLVCEKIWPHYITGYNSKNADLRELTIRATVHFAPVLTEALITTDVIKFISGGQTDPEGPIRTNATVCLAFLATTLPDSIRTKTLVNGFGRMLKDPFAPSRAAAVSSINSGIAAGHFPAPSIATQLMPAVVPLTVDKTKDVRSAALRCLASMMEVLEKHSETLGDAASHEAGGSTGGGGTAAVPVATTMTPSASSGTLAGDESGAAGWGWGWNSKKMGSGGERTTTTTTITPNGHKEEEEGEDSLTLLTSSSPFVNPSTTVAGKATTGGSNTESIDGSDDGGWGGGGATTSSSNSRKNDSVMAATTAATSSSFSVSPSKPRPTLGREGLSSSPKPPLERVSSSFTPSSSTIATAASLGHTTGGSGSTSSGGTSMKLGASSSGMKLGLKKKGGGLGGTKLD